jgi:hypothetical protein
MNDDLGTLSVPDDEGGNTHDEVSLSEINDALTLPTTIQFPGPWPVDMARRARMARLLIWEAGFSPEKAIRSVSPDYDNLDEIGEQVLAICAGAWGGVASPDPDRVTLLVGILYSDWWPDHYIACVEFEELGNHPDCGRTEGLDEKARSEQSHRQIREMQSGKYLFSNADTAAYEYAWTRAAKDDDEAELILSNWDEGADEDEDVFSARRQRERRRIQLRNQVYSDATAAAAVWMARTEEKYPHIPLRPTAAAEKDREAAINRAAAKESDGMTQEEQEVFAQAIDRHLRGNDTFNGDAVALSRDLRRLRSGWKLSVSQRDAVARAIIRAAGNVRLAGKSEVDALHPQLRYGMTLRHTSDTLGTFEVGAFTVSCGELQLVIYGDGEKRKLILYCEEWGVPVVMTPEQFTKHRKSAEAIFRQANVPVDAAEWRSVWPQLSRCLLGNATHMEPKDRHPHWIEYLRTLAIDAPTADKSRADGAICHVGSKESPEATVHADWLLQRAEEDGIVEPWEGSEFRSFLTKGAPGLVWGKVKHHDQGSTSRYVVIEPAKLPQGPVPRLTGPAGMGTAAEEDTAA